ncbi:MAG: hypothetical protein ACI3V0_05725 [Faecousia sp.]
MGAMTAFSACSCVVGKAAASVAFRLSDETDAAHPANPSVSTAERIKANIVFIFGFLLSLMIPFICHFRGFLIHKCDRQLMQSSSSPVGIGLRWDYLQILYAFSGKM